MLKLYDVIDSPSQLYLVMEFLDGENLSVHLKRTALTKQKASDNSLCEVRGDCVSESIACSVVRQLFEALAYMHSKLICHRDVKLENLIYNKLNGSLKLVDFGFATSCKEKHRMGCGTPSYMAPELVAKREYNGAETDMWAAGVCLYTILTGYLPFRGSNEKDLYRKIQIGKFAPAINAKNAPLSEEARDLISKLLCIEANARISAKDALQHPWF